MLHALSSKLSAASQRTLSQIFSKKMFLPSLTNMLTRGNLVKNNKTPIFSVLHYDITWVLTNQSACRVLSTCMLLKRNYRVMHAQLHVCYMLLFTIFFIIIIIFFYCDPIMYNFTTKPSYLHYLENYNDITHTDKAKKKLEPTTTALI